MIGYIRQVAKEVLGKLKVKDALAKKSGGKVWRFKKVLERKDIVTKFRRGYAKSKTLFTENGCVNC